MIYSVGNVKAQEKKKTEKEIEVKCKNCGKTNKVKIETSDK